MVTVNTGLMKLGDEPKSYDDLLDPRWKGRISMLLPRCLDVRSRVLGGEFAVGLDTDAWAEIKEGAPVKHPDVDTVILAARAAYIVRDAKALNIAKLWGCWVVSPAGQKTIHDVRGYSLIGSKTGNMYNYVQGEKVVNVPFDWRMKNEAQLSGKFRSVFREKKKWPERSPGMGNDGDSGGAP